jgi:mRNA interferase RelE/StbE
MSSRSYNIEFRPSAAKSLRELDRQTRTRVGEAIDALAEEPRPRGSKKIRGETAYRIRVGDLRILYDINDEVLIIMVLRIANRREAYRDLGKR